MSFWIVIAVVAAGIVIAVDQYFFNRPRKLEQPRQSLSDSAESKPRRDDARADRFRAYFESVKRFEASYKPPIYTPPISPKQAVTISGQPKEKPKTNRRSYVKNYFNVAVTLQISYVDANGDASSRKVKVTEVQHKNGLYYMMGFCSLVHEARTFRVDRVQHCIDVGTGEIVSDIVAFLIDHDLHKRYNDDKYWWGNDGH